HPVGVRGQLGRTLVGAARRDESIPGARRPGGDVQAVSYPIIGPDRGGGEVPRPAYRFPAWIDAARDRTVHLPPVRGRGFVVRGRAEQWLGEIALAVVKPHQPGFYRGR